MAKSHSKWQMAISERLKLDVSIHSQDDVPYKFSLNLRGYIEGKWEDLARYDNAHGASHRHECHPYRGDDVHTFLALLPETFIEAAETDLVQNAERYLEDFERELADKIGDSDE